MVVYKWIEGFAFFGMLFSCLLWVIFAWVTMRKLRKNPDIKNNLGMELISGYDAFNVAHALVFDKYRNKKVKSSLDVFDADLPLIYKHTTKFDRLLARVFYLLMLLSGSLLFLVSLINFFIKQ